MTAYKFQNIYDNLVNKSEFVFFDQLLTSITSANGFPDKFIVKDRPVGTYESIQANVNVIQGTVDGKYHIHITSILPPTTPNESFQKSDILNIGQFGYTGVLYQSPKYERYQYVFIRKFGEIVNDIIDLHESIYIYGLYLSDHNKYTFNPDQLDVYYDTIGTSDDIDLYTTLNENDPIFYNKFGSTLDDLIIIPINKKQDMNNITENQNIPLYYKDNNNLLKDVNNIDIPDIYNETIQVEETTQSIKLTVDNYYDNNYITNLTSIYNFSIYLNLNNIQNYINVNDLIRVDQNNPSANKPIFDIYTINNEYTLITGNLIYYQIQYQNKMVVSQVNFETNYNVEHFNSQNITLNNYNNKRIRLDYNNLYNYENVLGNELTHLIKYFTNIPNENLRDINKVGFVPFNNQVQIKEFYRYKTYLLNIGANNFIDYLSNSQIMKDVYKIYTQISDDNSNVETTPFQILIDKYGIAFVKSKNNVPQFLQLDYNLINDFFVVNGNEISLKIQDYITISKYYNSYNYVQQPPADGLLGKFYEYYSGVQFIATYTNILYKQLDNYPIKTDYKDPISKGEYGFLKINYDLVRLNMFNYIIYPSITLPEIVFNNKFVNDPDRQKIYGLAIDIEKSLNQNTQDIQSNFNNFKNAINNGTIYVDKFPIPSCQNKTSIYRLNTSLINIINNNFNIENVDTLYFDNTNHFNVYAKHIEIDNFVTDTTELTEFNKTLQNVYNNQNYKQSQNILNNTSGISWSPLNSIFLLYDNQTSTQDIIYIDEYNDFDYHVNDVKLINTSINSYVNILSYTSTDKQINITSNVGFQMSKQSPTVSQKEIILYNQKNSLYDVTSLLVNLVVINLSSNQTQNIVTQIEKTDFTYVNNDLYFDLYQLFDNDNYILINLTYTIKATAINTGNSQFKSIPIAVKSTYSDYDKYGTISINFRQHVTEEDLSKNIIYLNIHEQEIDNILPQVLYNEEISLSLFDINETIQKLQPNNKKVILFNNFIQNINTVQTLNDMTSNENKLDLQVLDYYNSIYTRSNEYQKSLPIFTIDNINKYVKIQLKATIDTASQSLFEEFRLENVYNLSLKDVNKGTLIVDGKISDLVTDIDFDIILKEYKTKLIFELNHNVNNSIKIPIYTEILIERFETYDDFTNNSNQYTYDIISNTILLDVKNRGEFIKVKSDFFSKTLDYIEYYEIYPEFSQQNEIEYIKELEISLISTDPSIIKISELFFDIFMITEDSYIGILDDYKNSPSDPENLGSTFNQSQDENEILDYFNQLIRHKCNNCVGTTIKLFLKAKPTFFGFNILAMTIGCYSHNIKIEQKIPYIFYKQSANTVMVVDKKTSIEKEHIYLPYQLRLDFQNNVGNDTYEYMNALSDSVDCIDITKYVDRPNVSKITYVIFNSSVNSKKFVFNYKNNQSVKIIHNDHIEFSIAPLEFKLVSLEEQINAVDYTNTFNSDIALYDVYEYSVDSPDTTTFIEETALPIPTLDDFFRASLNFFDKTAKYAQIAAEKNILFYSKNNNNSDYQTISSNIAAKIIKTNSDILTYKTDKGITNINYKFTINKTYTLTVDNNKLDDIINYMNQFNDLIYIKIPVKSIILSDQYFIGLPPLYATDTTTSQYYNNLFDTDDNIIYLVGSKTNVNQWTFNLCATLQVVNDDIIDELTNNNIINQINKLGINTPFAFLDPTLVLSLFFGDCGVSGQNFITNNFIIGYPETNPDILSTKFLDIISINNENNYSLAPSYKRLTLIGTSERQRPIDLIGNTEHVKDFINSKTDKLIVANKMLNDSLTHIPIKDISPYEEMLSRSLIDNSFTQQKVKSTNNNLISDNTKQINIYEELQSYETWKQDNAHDIVTSSDSFMQAIFSSNGSYNFSFDIIIKKGQPIKHFMSVKCDNSFDNIYNVKISNSTGEYYINYKGDYFITFGPTDNKINFTVNSLEFDNITINTEYKSFTYDNYLYKLYKQLIQQLLRNPIEIDMMDTNKEPILIIEDTNYKQIFNLTVNINKSIQSYLVIDKIKIFDNFINPTDYCINFTDNNEIYVIKSNDTKILKKEIYKYASDPLTFTIKGFNIPNQSGEFYTSLVIYYIFNGQHYSKSFDIRYRIKLPNVLDNEQLIANVTRLDNAQSPLVVNSSDSKYITAGQVDIATQHLISTYFNGLAGCNTELPDLIFGVSNK